MSVDSSFQQQTQGPNLSYMFNCQNFPIVDGSLSRKRSTSKHKRPVSLHAGSVHKKKHPRSKSSYPPNNGYNNTTAQNQTLSGSWEFQNIYKLREMIQ